MDKRALTRTGTQYAQLVAGIGQRIRLMREAIAITQSDLAEKLEVETITISRLETESTLVNLPLALKISEMWAIEMMWLATGRGSIFSNVPGAHIIGDIHSYAPCRAAIQLLAASPVHLDVALIECHEGNIGEVYGWIFLQHDWTDCLGIVLPGEEKPGQMTSALTHLIVQGHRFMGAYKIPGRDYEMLNKLAEDPVTKKFISFCNNKNLIAYWHEKMKERPTRLRVEEALERPLTPDVMHALEVAFAKEESAREKEAAPTEVARTTKQIADLLAQHNNDALNQEVLELIKSHIKSSSKRMPRKLKKGA